MKGKKIVLVVGLLLIIIILGVLYFTFCRPIVVLDNTTPAEEIVTVEYGLKNQLLAKAIYYVRRGFEDVDAFDLAREAGLTLKCKRQISETQFYYAVPGDYRCFIITDEDDIVQDVLVMREFPTIAQAEEWVEENRDSDRDIYTEQQYSFCNLWRDCGSGSVYLDSLFTLQDGAMIVRSTGKMENAEYLFFTDEEWKEVYTDWNGFVILPIDKQ